MKDHNIIQAIDADIEEMYGKYIQLNEKTIRLEKIVKGMGEKITKQQETIDLLCEKTAFLLNR